MLMEPTALQTSTLSMSLWKSLISFGESVCAAAQEHMTDETQRQSLLTLFHPLKQPDAEALADVAVRCYFEQPPAHIAAVNTLDHTQFVHPLLVPNICSIPVRDVLEAYPFFAFLQNIMKRGMVTSIQLSGSHSLPGLFLKGRVYANQPVLYGRVWLPLLDVAEIANPSQIRAKEGRDFIQQQMSLTPVAPPAMPSMEQLDGILKSVLGGFPGLQECIGKIVQGATPSDPNKEADLNDVVDQVQNVLVGPLMKNFQASNPECPDITPALKQILDGFRGLNALMTTKVTDQQMST